MPDKPKRSKALQEVIDRARSDPEFFHQLVFDPDAAMENVPRDNALRAAIYGIGGETVFAVLLGASRALVEIDDCTGTCGSASCTNTCGDRSCGGTCGSSCGDTCSHSCTDTTKLRFDFAFEARLGVEAEQPRAKGRAKKK